MPVIITIRNRGSGTYVHVAGKRVAQFQFTRNPNNFSEHQLVMSVDDWNRGKGDELLHAPGNPPMSVRFEPEAAPEDLRLKAAAEEAETAKAEALKKVDELTAELESVKHEAEQGEDAPSGRTAEMLDERDELLDALQPHSNDGETPLQTLTRILTVSEPGEPATAKPEPESYDALYAKAKAAGFSGPKPKREVLVKFLVEHPEA